MKPQLAHLLSLLLLCFVITLTIAANVDVVLRATWKSTSLLQEASEFFSDNDEELFWSFTSNAQQAKLVNSKAQYDAILDAAKEYKYSESKTQLLKYALSTRYYSPKLEAFNQLAKNELLENKKTTPYPSLFIITSSKAFATTAEEINQAVQFSSDLTATSPIEVLPFDHVFPECATSNNVVVLYANIAKEEFYSINKLLQEKCKVHGFKYVLRHFDATSFEIDRKDSLTNKEHDKLLPLQGYGVELQIKNMEYKQMDDSLLKYKQNQEQTANQEQESLQGLDFDKLIGENTQLAEQLKEFKQRLISNSSALRFGNDDSLKQWGIKDLGLQAAQLILKHSAADAVDAIQNVAQNFPTLSFALTKLLITSSNLRSEVDHNQKFMEAGKSFISVNGIKLEADKVTAPKLLDVIKAEASLKETLANGFHLKEAEIADILGQNFDSGDQRYNIIAPFMNDIAFINNVEQDQRYQGFPPSMQDMLIPTYHGQFRFSRKNLFTAVFIVDPSTRQGLDAIFSIFQMYHRGWPLRYGFLFMPSGTEEIQQVLQNKQRQSQEGGTQFVDVSVQGHTNVININKKADFQLQIKSLGAKAMVAFEFLRESRDAIQALSFFNTLRQQETITEQTLKDIFRAYTGQNLDSHLSNPKFVRKVAETIVKGVEQFGGAPGVVMPALIFNGKLFTKFQAAADSLLMEALHREHPMILSMIRSGKLRDAPNLHQQIMEELQAAPKYHTTIYTEKSQTSFVQVNLMDNKVKDGLIILDKDGSVKKVTHVIFADLNTKSGINLLLQSLKHLTVGTMEARVAVAHSSAAKAHPMLVQRLMEASSDQSLNSLISLLEQVVSHTKEVSKAIDEIQPSATPSNTKDFEGFLRVIRKTAAQLLEKNSIITNGRVITIDENTSFTASDFQTLELYELDKIAPIVLGSSAFAKLPNDDARSDLIFSVCATQFAASKSDSERLTLPIERLRLSSSSIKVNEDQDPLTTLPVVAVINPLSTEAQKLSSYLKVLTKHFKFPATIIMNPSIETTEIPLKSWYRYVLEPELSFDQTNEALAPRALFKQLPTKQILTLNMDVPETWLIESTYAMDDLDNINLQLHSDVEKDTVVARFQLENIIITGSVRDQSNMMSPPRGLELVLREKVDKTVQQDTLVMANYGYYQLKANPNLWTLSLSASHSTVYDIVQLSVARQSATILAGNQIIITSFDGPSVDVQVQKKPEKQSVDLLSLPTENTDPYTINIFSVCSGHMYERLLKIMITSVRKNTKKSPVKFWIIKNYLSPQFKQFLPLMAKQYNFDYEFVTYKWPTWLNKQTQKQRIIWAYKVLFLDVLFPLKVQKILFVDADQVTRADLTELFHHENMFGRPLAYTPFCDSRTDMEGYRFWKTGYWAQHLRGLPYHISALYLVDIDRFRKMYAGDQFRMIYDNLSKDPNSLSNLDQDLPNYAQHVVPIHSLKHNWLWCETWCSNEDKQNAKTIDLCNNPMTKEHKLESARRIIPEWTTYDEEVKQFEQSLRDKGQINY